MSHSLPWTSQHLYRPDFTLEGADLEWDVGLRMLLLRQMDQLQPGELVEVRSTNGNLDAPIAKWCEESGNELLSQTIVGNHRSFLICRGGLSARFEAPLLTNPELPRLVVRRLPALIGDLLHDPRTGG